MGSSPETNTSRILLRDVSFCSNFMNFFRSDDRSLMTADELKSAQKGDFIVMKTAYEKWNAEKISHTRMMDMRDFNFLLLKKIYNTCYLTGRI